MTQSVFEQFVMLIVVVDPIGTIPVFVAVTKGMKASERPRIALHAAAIAAGVLMFFLIVGQFLFEALGISLPAFQIAGSLVLFLFALTMIFGQAKSQEETESIEEVSKDVSPAIFPLAVPSIASPGAMLAIVLLTDNNRFSMPDQIITACIMLSVVAIACLLMLTAGPILKVIRVSGAEIVSRVMGMILAAVAVENIIAAVVELIKTTTL